MVCSEPAALLPSFARAAAWTVTLSPIFIVSRFQPPRVNAYGGPISILKFLTAPLSSFVSINTKACGFVQSSFVGREEHESTAVQQRSPDLQRCCIESERRKLEEKIIY